MYLLDIAARAEQRIVEQVSPGASVSVSPDGNLIAYPNYEHTGLNVTNLQIGVSETILAPSITCLQELYVPEWSHDDHYLAFAAERKFLSGGQIYMVDVLIT